MAAAPHVIDRNYLIFEQLGEGGMGAVFRATHRLSGRTVALKMLGRQRRGSTPGDSDERAQLLLALAREFETLSSLHHPNVIQVLDYGFDSELGAYFTMELLATPRVLTDEARGKSLTEKVGLVAQLLRALSYMHRRGIIHRDLKPSNVLCVQDTVKVMDFGLATKAKNPTEVAGTLEYLAPELWYGAGASVASDLYSVGVILFELLTGKRPFQSETQALAALLATSAALSPTSLTPAEAGATLMPDQVQAVTHERPPPVVEGPLQPIVAQLLAEKPEARYQSALAVLRDLSLALGIALPVETAETRESFLQASELVGRDAELRELLRHLGQCTSGQGSAFLLGGESGVGKSRLSAEVRTRALVGKLCVVTGQAVTEGGGSYQLWLAPLRALVLRVDLADDEAAILGELLPDLPELLGRPIPEAPKVPAAARPGRLRRAIEEVVRLQPRPTVILLEDLQWASVESLELLQHLSELAPSLPLFIVANYRDDELPGLPQRLPAMRSMQLKRLPREAVAQLAASMLGERGERADLVDYLCQHTEGNVFFLIEVVRALAEQSGQLDRVGDSALPAQLLTGGIERIAQRRVDRVPTASHSALVAAAILGRELNLDVLQQMLPELNLEPWLHDCANAAVLEMQRGDWRFAHDKLREALLRRVGEDERRTLHARAARAIESLYSGAARESKAALLAHHFFEAGEHEAAASYNLLAGNGATRLCSYAEARRRYAAARVSLDKLAPSPRQMRATVDILLQQIYTTLVADTAEQNFARIAEARALLERLAQGSETSLEDRVRLARVNFFHGRIHFYRNETRQALEYYRQVLPAAQESGDEELLALPASLIGTAVLVRGNAREAEPLLAQSIGPLERVGEPFEWFRAVGYHGMSLLALGRYDEGVSELGRTVARAHQIGQPSLLSASHLMTGTTYLISSDFGLVVEYLGKALGYAKQTGDKLHLSLAWSGFAWAQSHLGLGPESRDSRAIGESIAREMGGRLMLDDWYRAGDADMALNQGDLDTALALAEAVVASSEPAGLLFSWGVAERVLSEVRSLRGQHGEARTHIRRSLEAHERGGFLMQLPRTHFAAALQARRGDDRRLAESHHQQSAELLDRFGRHEERRKQDQIWSRIHVDSENLAAVS